MTTKNFIRTVFVGLGGGIMNIIFGTAFLQSGLHGLLMDYNRWIVGSVLIIIGIVNLYYSDIWRVFQKSSKEHTLPTKE